MAGVLEDITVMDLSRVLVGPFCSMMLADMGADVIKVEEPGVGDETRTWGPPFVAGEATYFLLDLGDLKDDPRYRTNPDRVQNRDTLVPILKGKFLSRSGEEWLELLQAAGIPSAPINTVDRALANPQVQARGMVVEVEHPKAGRLRLPGPPYKLSGTPATVRTAPPLLGQHTDEILTALGYSPAEIRHLHQIEAV